VKILNGILLRETEPHLCAIGSVEIIVASTLAACFTYPARIAYAGPVTRIADGIVFASAIICAI